MKKVVLKCPVFYVFRVGNKIINIHTLKIKTITKINGDTYTLDKDDVWGEVDLYSHWIKYGEHIIWLITADKLLIKILNFIGISYTFNKNILLIDNYI